MLDRSAQAVATQPEWLPHSFDEDGRRIAAVHVPREEHARLTFLNDQFFQNRYPVAINEVEAVESALGGRDAAPLHFIFHTAFCCSTLLVRALDVPGVTTGLKEPCVLNDIALRMSAQGGGNRTLLDLTLRLLARPFDGDGAVIVKASNVANRLIAPALESLPDTRAVLLYSSLRSFLLAVAKQGQARRTWARQLFSQISKWSSLGPTAQGDSIDKIGDLPIAALTWLMQMQAFTDASRRFGSARVMMLNSAALLGTPTDTLSAVVRHFALGLDPTAVQAIVDGPVFASHSKALGTIYNADARRADEELAARVHGAEVEQAIAWLRDTSAAAKVTLPAGSLD